MPPKQDKSVPDFIPDVRTGATAGQSGKYYASGISTPPNGGQVTDVDNPEPNDAPDFIPDNPPPAPKPPERFSTELLKEIPYAAGQAGLGALKGAGSTLDAIGQVVYPDWLEKRLTGKVAPDHAFDATNPFQSAGKGAEQAAEFLIPGLGEEDAVSAGTKLLPIGEKVAKPLSRIAYNAITSGLINKEQGGGFVNGAAAGGAASTIGEGLKALAPRLAESALNIRKLDRAYGKGGGSIGHSILDETSGWRPGTVAASAQSRLDELNPMLNDAADRASLRRAPVVRGFLEPPAEEVRLGDPFVPEMPGALVDAERFPAENVGEARVIRNSKGQILPKVARKVEFPESKPPARISPIRNERGLFVSSEGMTPEGPRERPQLPIGRNPNNGQMLARTPTRSAFMAGSGEEMEPVGNQRVGPGVMFRKPEMSGSIPPTLEANPSASLRSARNAISRAAATAGRQGERTTTAQLQPLMSHLTETMSGEPIPENITPRQLLDLKRGFGNEFIHRWNPETMQGVKGTAANAYHQMANEFNRVVPEAEELNGRIGRLIPVVKRGESAELNAPTTQRIAHRVAAHTGALTGGVFGAEEGYRKDGVPGALAGGLLGVALPEMATSPTAEMGTARMLYRSAKPLSRVATGGVLQLDRKPKND